MSFSQVLQYCLSGVTVGSIYAIVAIGFNIIYNATGIVNFAQGEFLVLGGMISITLSSFMPLFPAILLAVIITVFVGAAVEMVFIRWLKSPGVLRLIVITIGIAILMRESMLHIWDEKIRVLKHFTGTEISSINVLGAYISPQVLWVLGISAVIVVLLSLFFKFTLIGKAMRACAANRTAARLCGIKTKWIVTYSFMISAGIGAIAGCVISPLAQTQYDMGSPLAIKGFTVAILGGLGNSIAAVIAGIIMGLIESFSISVLPLAYKDVVTIGVLLLILFLKPSGLFGKKEESALKEF